MDYIFRAVSVSKSWIQTETNCKWGKTTRAKNHSGSCVGDKQPRYDKLVPRSVTRSGRQKPKVCQLSWWWRERGTGEGGVKKKDREAPSICHQFKAGEELRSCWEPIMPLSGQYFFMCFHTEGERVRTKSIQPITESIPRRYLNLTQTCSSLYLCKYV